ncbi:MAG: metal ABC transporter substrate-binding protein [Candidatus Acetothermia bacterium]|jgi:ABC-type Zn uptake system ZnuABC Zn-binding protein ZnuA|nr:metal ABC transporter substrate-binding protein [Candidatus Acetothermia bacterium]MDH7506098.1 metal ABC transporter substrate-binding protein [Candidatus Acetothermia bacterium]
MLKFRAGLMIAALLPLLALCPGQADQPLRVVATTTIVGDVVRAIGGEQLSLTVLLPVGSDPHAYEPRPEDLIAVAEAELIAINGVGLEEFLEPLLRNSGTEAEVLSVSDGIALRRLDGGELDPHVWFDPQNVMIWVRNIERKLAELDPANAELYAANAASYRAALEELDAWIIAQVGQVPQHDRELVTDHLFLGYFADRYGFVQIGAIFPGLSTLAEPSARELAELEAEIRRLGVKAIFVGTSVNPALAQQIAADTGVQVVFLYTGSLSGPEGPAASYLELMRYDVAAIIAALK